MFRLQDKNVLVIGLGLSGAAAARLLVSRGARVTAMANSDTPDLRREVEELRDLGVRVELDLRLPTDGQFDFAVVSPGVPMDSLLVKELRQREIPSSASWSLAGKRPSASTSLSPARTGRPRRLNSSSTF